MTGKIAQKAVLVYPKFPKETFWSRHISLREYVPPNEFGLPKAVLPPLALMGLFGYLKNHGSYDKIVLIDRNVDPRPLEDLVGDADDVYFSAMNIQADTLFQDLITVQRLNKRIIVGGPITNEHLEKGRRLVELPNAVFVVGEAENVIDELTEELTHSQTRKVYRRSFADSANFFMPDYSSINLQNYFGMPVQFSRGCPFSCEFCNVKEINGRTPRIVSDEYIEQTLQQLFKLGWRGDVYIVDDNPIGNPKRAIEILKKIMAVETELGYVSPKSCEVSLNLSDETPVMNEIRRLFRESGFLSMFIGVETNNESALFSARKRQNLHGEKTIKEKLEFIQRETGAKLTMGGIFGFDDDTPESAERLVQFINETGIPTVMFGLLNAPEGSDLFGRLGREGRLYESEPSNNTEGRINFVPYHFSVKEAEEIYIQIIKGIYDKQAYFGRVMKALKLMNPEIKSFPDQLNGVESLSSAFKVLTKQNRFTYLKYLREAHSIAKERFGFGSKGYTHIIGDYLAFCALYTHAEAQVKYLDEQNKKRQYNEMQLHSRREMQEKRD